MSDHEEKPIGGSNVQEVGAGSNGTDPKSSKIGVRVRTTQKHCDGKKHRSRNPQRVFSYTQMFFFLLCYMSSWEAIVT